MPGLTTFREDAVAAANAHRVVRQPSCGLATCLHSERVMASHCKSERTLPVLEQRCCRQIELNHCHCSQGWLGDMEKQVRMAERALLYQLAFVVDAALPYAAVDTMVQHARSFDERTFPNRVEIIQSCWNFINDR